ncbi:chaperonin 10-like protein [Rhypophila decipiens]|uniref:Chaperonin 10-like protein n=1 Tax=Rhypophila decipiens TaxID=261697 RepID=A0AAN6Y9F6_9PEZI|nr:chaperonin 10-like protein [Rhypophila decipiens]
MMKGLILNAEAKTASVQAIPIPKLDNGKRQLLIRIEAIALNPVDSLYVRNPIGETGRTVGSDFAGVVVAISPSQKHLQIGDRIAGLVQGSNSANSRPGAFAEYLLLQDDDVDLVWKVPSWMTLEDAAGVSLCGLTAAQGAFYRLGIPAPFSWAGKSSSVATASAKGEDGTTTVLIYGASTSLGLYAAQLVNLGFGGKRNLRLIGLASKSKFEMLKKEPYHYTHLLDYHSPDWPSQVREMVGEQGVDYALDCISEGDTVRNILSTLGKEPHNKVAIFRSKQSRAWDSDGIDTSKAIYGAVWEGLGHDIVYGNGMNIRATEESRNFTVGFYNWLSSGRGKLEPNPIRLMPGGLERIVPDGFALLGGGRMEDRDGVRERTEEWMRPVSAEKLVYKISD